MMENIDFTSDEPTDQKGIMTNFDENDEKNRGKKRKAEEITDGIDTNGNGDHSG